MPTNNFAPWRNYSVCYVRQALRAKTVVMNPLTRTRISIPHAALAVAFLLSSCAGTGGHQGPVASVLDFPVAGVVLAEAKSTQQINLAGSLDGTAFTYSVLRTPGPASTFEGRPASTRTESSILRANGVLVSQSLATLFFSPSPYVDYGLIDLRDGSYTVFNQVANYPEIATVGQSGLSGTAVVYADSSKAQVLWIGTAAWSLEAATAVTAALCVNVHMTGATPFTASECDQIDGAGKVLSRVVKLGVNGKTLTLQ